MIEQSEGSVERPAYGTPQPSEGKQSSNEDRNAWLNYSVRFLKEISCK